MAMTSEKKNRISKYLVVMVIIVSFVILWGFTTGVTGVVWFLAIFNLLFGPCCLFFYLLEVKRGVFKNIDGQE